MYVGNIKDCRGTGIYIVFLRSKHTRMPLPCSQQFAMIIRLLPIYDYVLPRSLQQREYLALPLLLIQQQEIVSMGVSGKISCFRKAAGVQ